jgi:hypothetical protein
VSSAAYATANANSVELGSRLSAIGLEQLNGLLDAYLAAIDAINGVYCQPRLDGDEDELAIVILAEELDRLGLACAEIAAEAELRRPEKDRDADLRAEILVTWALRCGEDWSEIAQRVITVMADRTAPTRGASSPVALR